MGILIKLGKDAQESAVHYHQLAKKLHRKAEGLEKAIAETKKKLKGAGRRGAVKKTRKRVRVVREKEWYESFGWSFTNSGKLVLIGRNAKQNDVLVARHMDEKDLFFHADIRGGSATILKGGKDADKSEREFAAVLAASFSKAWGKGFSQVDSYYVEKAQLGKHSTGGFVGAGGFAISGRRMWYKNVALKLRVGVDKEGRVVVGAPEAEWMEKSVVVVPGKKGKGTFSKEVARILDVNEVDVQSALPAGGFGIVKS